MSQSDGESKSGCQREWESGLSRFSLGKDLRGCRFSEEHHHCGGTLLCTLVLVRWMH